MLIILRSITRTPHWAVALAAKIVCSHMVLTLLVTITMAITRRFQTPIRMTDVAATALMSQELSRRRRMN